MANERDTLVWPIVLIVLGVLFLAHNLEFIQWRQLREILGTWWPLILIALGLAQLARRRK
jgi:ribose/xylose/arabinose/galactoside ABC-type transport system permease subunit